MMNRQDIEIIPHNPKSFHIFMVSIIYRTPHFHKDFEISCVLEGSITVRLHGDIRTLHPGELFIVNPFEVHELEAESPALILSLQLDADYFRSVGTDIGQIVFASHWPSDKDNTRNKEYTQCLMNIACSWFQKQDFWELKCTWHINEIFYELLNNVGYVNISDQEKSSSHTKMLRMRKVIKIINERYREKLYLSDIAETEHLTLHYLSHFFKDTFGISFQEYLAKIRCEHARQLLIQTDLHLLDICMECGFSDPKYFNRKFAGQYGCTPKEYRKSFETAALVQQQKSMLSTQKFLSDESSLVLLDRIWNGGITGTGSMTNLITLCNIVK